MKTEEYIAQEPERRLKQSFLDLSKELKQIFGFTADPNKSLKANVRTQIFNKQISYFKNQMQNMAFHVLCKIEKTPSNTSKLLKLNGKFCTQSRLPRTDLITTFSNLSRSICIKCFMDCVSKEQPQGIGNPTESNFNPKLYIKNQAPSCNLFC